MTDDDQTPGDAADPIPRNLGRMIRDAGTNPSAVARRAGLNHTAARDILTGKVRNPTTRVLAKLADALGVSLSQLTGDAPPHGGFAEPGDAFETAGAAHSVETPTGFLAAVAPNARNPACFRLSQSLSGFALLKGDLLVLDLARTAQTGEIVLATVVDQDTGEAATITRRYLPPYLVAGDPADLEQTMLADGNRVSVLAPVDTVVRQGKPGTRTPS